MFKETINYHIGHAVQIPAFSPCKVIKYNNSTVTVYVEATGKEETVRNIPKRMFPFSGNLKLIEALYGT